MAVVGGSRLQLQGKCIATIPLARGCIQVVVTTTGNSGRSALLFGVSPSAIYSSKLVQLLDFTYTGTGWLRVLYNGCQDLLEAVVVCVWHVQRKVKNTFLLVARDEEDEDASSPVHEI